MDTGSHWRTFAWGISQRRSTRSDRAVPERPHRSLRSENWSRLDSRILSDTAKNGEWFDLNERYIDEIQARN